MKSDGILIWFDGARRGSRFLSRARKRVHGRSLTCVGYPTARVTAQTIERVRTLLGTRVDSAFETESAELHRKAFEESCASARGISADAPLDPASTVNWSVSKENDRVMYRMSAICMLRLALDRLIDPSKKMTIFVPWRGWSYESVERPGLLGFDAPGSQLFQLLAQLERQGHEVVELWPHLAVRDVVHRAVSRAAFRTGRLISILSKALEASRQSETREKQGQRILFLVGGVSQYHSLEPLILSRSERGFEDVVATFETIRPQSSARRASRNVQTVNLASMASIGKTAKLFSMGEKTAARTRRLIAKSNLSTESRTQLEIDTESIPELEVYAAQLREAIRRFRPDSVVSANCVDRYLSATTQISHEFDLRHVCIQNASIELVPQPRFADCDLFFADSVVTADFLNRFGAIGAVRSAGLPYYDTLAQRRARQPAPRSSGKVKVIVGVATQPEEPEFEALLIALMELAERRGDVELRVKRHPRESARRYADIEQALIQKSLGRFVSEAPLDFVSASTYLVSATSTMIQWALMMNVRPFALLSPSWCHFAGELLYLQTALTTKATSVTSLVEALNGAIDMPDESWKPLCEEFVAQAFTGCDGNAVTRILMEIDDRAAVGERPRCSK